MKITSHKPEELLSPGKSSMEDITYFETILRKSGSLMTITAQAMGFYPFSVDHRNNLTFQWLSLPALMPYIQTMLIAADVYNYWKQHEKVSKQFSAISANNVDRFGDSLTVNSVLVVGTLLRIAGLLRRKNVMDISERLQSVLMEIYKNGTEAAKAVFEQELKQHTRFLVRILSFTYSMMAVIAFQSVIPVINRLKWNAANFNVLGIIVWYSHLMLLISKTLWFVHVIDLTRIGFLVLRSDDGISNSISIISPKTKTEKREFLFCKHYEALDGLIHDFNEKFFFELTMIVTLLGILLVNSLYVTSGTIRRGIYYGLLETMPDTLVHFFELYILCNSATWIVREAQATVQERMNNPNPAYDEALLKHLSYEQIQVFLMKAISMPPVISPGYFFVIDRQFLTSILGAISTFLIVLLQFRNS